MIAEAIFTEIYGQEYKAHDPVVSHLPDGTVRLVFTEKCEKTVRQIKSKFLCWVPNAKFYQHDLFQILDKRWSVSSRGIVLMYKVLI